MISLILSTLPNVATGARQLLEKPARELAHLFWLAYVHTEEIRRQQAELEAWTAWWVHNGIEFAKGHKHYGWDEWLDLLNITRPGERKTRRELVAEINDKWNRVFHPGLRFAEASMFGNEPPPPNPQDKQASRDWVTRRRGIVYA